jgi:hypothetical protein
MSKIRWTVFHTVLAVPLTISFICAVGWSWHWPLVGDASLMHYVVFLMSKGLRPYKDIVDINLPGSYFFEAFAMHLLGWGALAWRVYDLFLLTSIGAAILFVSGPRHLFSGFVASVLFALIHIQDGVAELGQRDLLVAALVLWAYVALFAAQRKPGRAVLISLSGLLIGVSLTIKPTFLMLGIVLLLLSTRSARQAGIGKLRCLGYGAAGLVTPPLIVAGWLYGAGSLQGFRILATTLIPFHAELGRRSLSYLIVHSTSPIAPLCVAWLVVLIVMRPRMNLERLELLAGVGCAFLSYVMQGKGLSYHRYPFLALVLVTMEMDFVEALSQTNTCQMLAVAALAFECYFVAPRAAWLSRSFTATERFEQALGSELLALPLPLSKEVQCLDTFGGCINTLYDLRIVQSTGYLYDCYLFTPHQNETTARYRAAFWTAYLAARPQILVVTDQFCFGDEGGFNKIHNWPVLDNEIANKFALKETWQSPVKERWWSRSEFPFRFRIYVRNGAK